jgi:hypothetical protein
MRIRRWWGLGAGLMMIAVAAPFARATDEDGKAGQRPILRPTERPGLIDKLFDLGPPAPAKKPDAKASKKDAGDKDKSAAAPALTEQDRQEAALLRRIDVCDKLRQIAFETNNNELDQLAQELDARARAVYSQRTARLKPTAQMNADVDEQILDKKLGIEPMNPEKAPLAKPSASRTGKPDQYQAATKGEDR